MATVSEQRQPLVGFRSSPAAEPERSGAEKVGSTAGRRPFRLPLLRRSATGEKVTRRERSVEKERQKQLQSTEAAEAAFFQTPAGKARLAYKRGHRLFQYELSTGELSPVVVPGPIGSPARETTDPVDILNSVTVEGWKLVTGKFIHSEMRGGAIGVYLFKRSQKRRLPMNNPWQAPGTTD